MADGFTAAVDVTAVAAAFARLGDVAIPYVKTASKISAESMQSEMKRRVARATGETADTIMVSDVGDGYAVHTVDVNPFTGRYYHMLHVGLYLEKGTALGKRGSHASTARPWFFVSAQLEESAHERRIKEALEQAAEDVGLGQ